MKGTIVVGVDIGGSHITVALINIDNGEIIPESYFRNRIDSKAEAHFIIKSWVEVIKKSLKVADNINIPLGIAMPGPFDYENGISYIKAADKYDSLYGLNVKALLCAELNVSPDHIRFQNDAACFLQGEIYGGELRKYKNAIGLTLGTGMGSAYMINGKAFDANLWNMPFNNGIIEDYISSRWFVNEFAKRAGIIVHDVKDLVESYGTNTITKSLFEEFSSNLFEFLYQFFKQRNAEVIILGGNICKAEPFFLRQVQKKFYEQMGKSIPIYLSVLGENAALMGAASLFGKNKINKQSYP